MRRGVIAAAQVLATAATAATVATAATRAHAATLAVLPVVVAPPDAAEEITALAAYEAAARAAAARPGLAPIPRERVFSPEPGGIGAAVRECGSDAACISRRLDRANVDLALIVTVDTTLDPPLIALQLIHAGATGPPRLDAAALAPGEGPALPALAARVRALLDHAGFAEGARITVDVQPADATVRVGDGVAPEPDDPHTYVVPPGTYRIVATREGHAEAAVSVAAEAGRTTRAALVLEPERPLLRSPWLWAAVAAAAIGGAAAIALAASSGARCTYVGTSADDARCE